MQPKMYTKKPVTIRAMQITPESFQHVVDWIGVDHVESFDREQALISIKTLEGIMKGGPGDYIICGVRGEFYPCKADIFDLSYTQVVLS